MSGAATKEEGFEVNFLSGLDTLCTQSSVALGMLPPPSSGSKDGKNATANATADPTSAWVADDDEEALDVTAEMNDDSFEVYGNEGDDGDKYEEEEYDLCCGRRNMCLCLTLLLVVLIISIAVPTARRGNAAAAENTGNAAANTSNATVTSAEWDMDANLNNTVEVNVDGNMDAAAEIAAPQDSSSSEEEGEIGQMGEEAEDGAASSSLPPSEDTTVTITKVQKGNISDFDVDELPMPVCVDGITAVPGDIFCYNKDDGRGGSRNCKFFGLGDTDTRLKNHCNEDNPASEFCDICWIYMREGGN